VLGHTLSYRDYGTAVITANSNPFYAALFTGGSADIFRAHIAGSDFETIRAHLCKQFPDSSGDITKDIADVASFFAQPSAAGLPSHQPTAGTYGTMAPIKGFAREHRLLTHVTIELNTKCNLRCEHCFHSDYTSQGLHFDIIEKLLMCISHNII
jgi:hypothetical protein